MARPVRRLWRGESRGTLLASLVLCGYALALPASAPALSGASLSDVGRERLGDALAELEAAKTRLDGLLKR